MKTNHSSEFLGTEKISKLLFSFSMPAFIAMLASGIYNIVDTIFIGKGNWNFSSRWGGHCLSYSNVIQCFRANDFHWCLHQRFQEV